MSRVDRIVKRKLLQNDTMGEFVLRRIAQAKIEPKEPYEDRASTRKKKRKMAKATRKAQRSK